MEITMKRKLAIPAAIIAIGLATAGAFAYANQSSTTENDALADLAKARISLVDAVNTAQQLTGGKATRAELDGERGTTVFNIEVATADQKVLDVRIDAITGTVLATKEDKRESGEREEQDD